MARLLTEQGEIEQAADLLHQLRNINAKNPDVIELDGTVALLQDRNADAVVFFREALERRRTSTATLKLAFAQQHAGDEDGSRSTLEQWIQHSLEDVDARLVLANKYLRLGDLDKARSHYTKIVLLWPNNPVALNNLAWVSLRLGDPEGALLHAERVFQLAPNNARILDTYGLAQLEAGNAGEAVRVLRRAVHAEPGNPEIQSHLAQALAKQGKEAEAGEILRQILSEDAEFSERHDAEALLKDLGG